MLGFKEPLRFTVLFAALATVALALSAPMAVAAPAQVVIDSAAPELKQAESGGGSTVELRFANLTDQPAAVEAEAVGQAECAPTLTENLLPPAQITAVTVELPEACDRGEALKLKITAALPGAAPQTFEVDPSGEPATKPDWHQLWAFGVGLAGALFLLAVLCIAWLVTGKRSKSSLWQPLSALDATWKFNDNWATNATAAGALLTGLFSATTAKAWLGSSAEALTALATVGAAIALALVGAAPILALATKSYRASGGKRGDAFTVFGVLAAAALVLAGAVGQLWVIAYTASQLSLGSAGWLAWLAFALALALLLVYAVRSLYDVLERGTEEKPNEAEIEMKAADVIAKAIEGKATAGTKGTEAFGPARQAVSEGEEAAADGYRRRPRSALI